MQRLLIGTLFISLGSVIAVMEEPNSCSAEDYGYVLHNLRPTHWPTLCPGCAGERQSPIDIKTNTTTLTTWDPPLQIMNYGESILGGFKNDGKTLKWSALEVNPDVKLMGGPLNTTYLFGQFHMHWGAEDLDKGSEHTLDGKQKSAEIHFVWFKEEYGTLGDAVAAGVAGDGDALAVIGVFIDYNPDACPEEVEWFDPIFDAAVKISEAEDQEAEKVTQELVLQDIIDVFEPYSGFYHYKGSLTTPDCFEIVNWIVVKDHVTLTPAQMEPLRKLVFYTECEKALMGDNFRSPDDLPEASTCYERPVEEYVQPPAVTCICEAENGAVWSMHPGFPFNGIDLIGMGYAMDMLGDEGSEVSVPM